MSRPQKKYRMKRNGDSLQVFEDGEYVGSVSLKYLVQYITGRSDDEMAARDEQWQREEGVGKEQKYGPKNIYKRLKRCCGLCGFDGVVDVHHIEGVDKKEGRSLKDIDNLIVLCPNHHAMYHRGKISKEDLYRANKGRRVRGIGTSKKVAQ